MLFNSFEFLFFLPIVFLLYWFVFTKSVSYQNTLVLFASYFFYAWWSLEFLGLLVLITILDYSFGFLVASLNRNKSRFFLWFSVINNLGILCVFKYYNFFAIQLETAFRTIGFSTNPVLLKLALPIGISFYTFHGMSYVFDIYNGKQKPISNFIDYAVFVSFFPLLVAGPIERASHLLPQIQKKRQFSYSSAVDGCRLILWGMFKKVVIADSLSIIVDDIFKNYQLENGVTLIIGAISFSFQIYCDFSGYSDIAIGTAKLFGFELLSNFKFPYFSRDIAEFWRRWHISLSSWFRDYLYIPLGGSRHGKMKAIINTFIIFLVSGFWHGASWNFIVWGFVHACGFLPLLLFSKNRKYVSDVVAVDRILPNFREILQMIKTFFFVTFAWVFFRADNIGIAIEYFKKMAYDIYNYPGQILLFPEKLNCLLYIVPLIILDWYFRRNERELKMSKFPFINSIIVIIMAVFILNNFLGYLDGKPSSFIYFQF